MMRQHISKFICCWPDFERAGIKNNYCFFPWCLRRDERFLKASTVISFWNSFLVYESNLVIAKRIQLCTLHIPVKFGHTLLTLEPVCRLIYTVSLHGGLQSESSKALTCRQRILSLWIGHNAAARSAASHFSLAALPASRVSLCTTIVKVQVRAAQEEPPGDTWREKVLWSFVQQPDSRGYWSGKPAICVLETLVLDPWSSSTEVLTPLVFD